MSTNHIQSATLRIGDLRQGDTVVVWTPRGHRDIPVSHTLKSGGVDCGADYSLKFETDKGDLFISRHDNLTRYADGQIGLTRTAAGMWGD